MQGGCGLQELPEQGGGGGAVVPTNCGYSSTRVRQMSVKFQLFNGGLLLLFKKYAELTLLSLTAKQVSGLKIGWSESGTPSYKASTSGSTGLPSFYPYRHRRY